LALYSLGRYQEAVSSFSIWTHSVL
jgi:hypothetical protein